MPLDRDTRDQLLETVRRFVRETCVPLEAKVSEEDRVPESIISEMRELGLFGLSIPVEYGGLGLTMEEEVLVAMELGHTSPAFRSVIGTNVGIGSQGVVMFGTEAQKKEWLPKLASGEVVASFALTEPEAGSDAASVRTTAIRDGDHYVVNGTKRFITNANRAGMFTLMARSDPERKGAGGISAFIVPADTPGISVGKPEKKMGQQGAHICDVNFDNARVPASLRLGAEGEGFKVAMQVLDRSRPGIGAQGLGLAQGATDYALEYAKSRETMGKPIAQHQLIAGMLSDMETKCEAARGLLYKCGQLIDEGADGPELTKISAMAKLYCTDVAMEVTTDAVQILGGYGYIQEYPVERMMRDAKITQIYEGTNQIQRLVIAREMLKENRAFLLAGVS
jgi:acyl-CoA dehydrogenase